MSFTPDRLAAEIASSSAYAADQERLALDGLDIPSMKASMARSLISTIHMTSGLTYATAQPVNAAIDASPFAPADKTSLATAVSDRIATLLTRGECHNSTQKLTTPETYCWQSIIDILNSNVALEVKL